eukprot:gene3012-3470_t
MFEAVKWSVVITVLLWSCSCFEKGLTLDDYDCELLEKLCLQSSNGCDETIYFQKCGRFFSRHKVTGKGDARAIPPISLIDQWSINFQRAYGPKPKHRHRSDSHAETTGNGRYVDYDDTGSDSSHHGGAPRLANGNENYPYEADGYENEATYQNPHESELYSEHVDDYEQRKRRRVSNGLKTRPLSNDGYVAGSERRTGYYQSYAGQAHHGNSDDDATASKADSELVQLAALKEDLYRAVERLKEQQSATGYLSRIRKEDLDLLYKQAALPSSQSEEHFSRLSKEVRNLPGEEVADKDIASNSDNDVKTKEHIPRKGSLDTYDTGSLHESSLQDSDKIIVRSNDNRQLKRGAKSEQDDEHLTGESKTTNDNPAVAKHTFDANAADGGNIALKDSTKTVSNLEALKNQEAENKKAASKDQPITTGPAKEPDTLILHTSKSVDVKSLGKVGAKLQNVLWGIGGASNVTIFSKVTVDSTNNKDIRLHVQAPSSSLPSSFSATSFKPSDISRWINAGAFDESLRKNISSAIGLTVIGARVEKSKQITGFPKTLPKDKNWDEFVIIIAIVCGCTLGLIAASVIICSLKRRSHQKRPVELHKKEAITDYEELCRTKMAVSSSSPRSTKAMQADRQRHGLVDGQGKITKKSWREEPLAYNMDITTGHVILAYMEEHLKNENKLSTEWEALCNYKADQDDTTVGEDSKNSNKNRYSNVLPYDHTRVKLRETANVFHSDYINASYITDVDPRNPAYIATQGPLDNTVADFWQMIWEQGVVVIVNLTRLSDMGLPQCHRYWPKEGSDVYNAYQVHLISEHIWCDDYIVRSFYLKHLLTSETRTVTQFHFLTWPDLSVPESAKAVLEFRRKVNKCYRGQACPIVIHCNNGVGRTGTYILIDMVLKKMIKGTKEIDIAATLEHLRDQRPDMVKTKAQFEFTLAAVAEEIFRSACRKSAIFKLTDRDKKITGGLISSFHAPSLSLCLKNCLDTATCKTFNFFGNAVSGSSVTCELLSVTRAVSGVTVSATGWKHYEPVQQAITPGCIRLGTSVACSPGYRCEESCEPNSRFKCIDINECASNPCYNGGVCYNYVNYYSCSCPPGSYGSRCWADNRVKKSTPEQQVPPEIKNFKTTIHKTLFPQLITRNGRTIKFTELSHGNKKSSVRVYMAEDFLSKQECDGLMRVHLRHVASTAKKSPIVCFADLDTMRKHLDEAGYKGKTSMEDFTKGTFCVNESFSQKIAPSFKYSYSTAFYRDESKFAATFEELLESATGLARSHGGKFQITSYEHGVGYKNHTDCVEDNELRDRFATVLVYLQDVKVGGETKFPQLGISVKPKRGRLIVWNNMRPDGSCDPTSIHNAAKVVDGRKVIIQRWYYYQNFYSLGKRPPEPELPKRQELQPCVLCDEYVQGSCRWYDEWGYSHLINYRLLQHKLS